MDITPRLYILTAPRSAGKTTFCRALASQARATGWDVAGLLSPAIFENEVKTSILAENVRTGESRCLASITQRSSEDIFFGMWYFDSRTLEWGNHILASSTPCDLLIVDELGPLEFIYQKGWQSALTILPHGRYRVALVVIRPELLAMARNLINYSEIIHIDPDQKTDAWIGTCLYKILTV
jgi:nucleoside-triphosphatase THEP1